MQKQINKQQKEQLDKDNERSISEEGICIFYIHKRLSQLSM